MLHNDEDQAIMAMEQAAAAWVEARTGRSLLRQTWQLSMDCFPRTIELLHGPVEAITSVTYKDANNADAVLTSYLFDNGPLRPWITPSIADPTWPTVTTQPGCVRVIYTTGADDRHGVPATAKSAIKLLVGQWYENREAGGAGAEIPFGVEALISPLVIPALF
mgnify:CR=1 FL=1